MAGGKILGGQERLSTSADWERIDMKRIDASGFFSTSRVLRAQRLGDSLGPTKWSDHTVTSTDVELDPLILVRAFWLTTILGMLDARSHSSPSSHNTALSKIAGSLSQTKSAILGRISRVDV